EQNEIRIWPKKKQGYGYHYRSPSIKKNHSKSLCVSGAFKHPKYSGIENDIAFLIKNEDSFRKTNLFKFFFPKSSRSNRPTIHLLKRTLPALRPSLNYSVMQYLLNTKKKMYIDPVVVLNHFVAQGVAETSTMGGSNDAREKLLVQLRRKCRNLMGKDKVMELMEKFIDLNRIGELIRGIKMMIEIILRNRRIPYGQIGKDIPLVMKKGVDGIHICISGRLEGVEIARTESR
ncbi:hypothetical protein EJD97_015482, partial [Solanum chilense]